MGGAFGAHPLRGRKLNRFPLLISTGFVQLFFNPDTGKVTAVRNVYDKTISHSARRVIYALICSFPDSMVSRQLLIKILFRWFILQYKYGSVTQRTILCKSFFF
jgi:hypothetical protein